MPQTVQVTPLPVFDPAGAFTAALNHFRASLITGSTTGMAANAAIASLRWAPSNTSGLANQNLVYVLLQCDVAASVVTAFTTAQPVDAELIIARSFTVADSGGTAVTLGALSNNQKMRTRYLGSQVADLRVSTTAGLTAGTRTLDGVGIASTVITDTAIGAGGSATLYTTAPSLASPVVLEANEGLIVRVPTAQGAAGVVKYYVSLAWAEVSASALGF